MNFRDKLKLLLRPTITREIMGQTFTFWPISLTMLAELTANSEPIMRAVRAIFAEKGNDGTSTIEETKDPTTGRTIQKIVHLGAPDPAVLRAREELREKSLRQNMEALLGKENRMMVGRLLADSLRDEGIRTDADIVEFMNAVDLSVLVEFVQGFLAVNGKVFGPLGERVKELVRERLSNLAQKSRPAQADSDSADPAPQPSGQPSMSPDLSNPFGSVGLQS